MIAHSGLSRSLLSAAKIHSSWVNPAISSSPVFSRAGVYIATARSTDVGRRSFHAFPHGIARSANASHVRSAKNTWCWTRVGYASLSRFFIKEVEEFTEKEHNRFERDEHYEKVRSQNFGPVPVSRSDLTAGRFSETSREYARRSYLDFNGLKYDKLPVVLISAKYNNTFVTIDDCASKKLYATETCGKAGFKNASKKTPHAAEMVGKQAAERALLKGCPEHVRVKVKGPGYGRAAAIRGLVMGGLKIVSITDITPLHVDGLPQRPRKIRRV